MRDAKTRLPINQPLPRVTVTKFMRLPWGLGDSHSKSNSLCKMRENVVEAGCYPLLLEDYWSRCIAELHNGIVAKGRTDPTAAKALSAWLEGLEFGFADRILGVDVGIARLWGEWSAHRPRPVIDTLLAATAAQHALTLVRRNTRDISGLPVRVHNPWVD
jgi:predicted nucleic acid-binding protein